MKILGFAGSLRAGSYNKMALRLVLQFAKEAGAEVEEVDLKELNIPLYDGDLEEKIQLPEGIKTLKKKIAQADGIIIASPEYNHSISSVLKTTIDWLSRKKFAPDILSGKPITLFGASDGAFGTVRAQIAFYPIANTLNLALMPSKVYISNADEKFDEKGNCTDEKTREKLKELSENFVAFVKKNA